MSEDLLKRKCSKICKEFSCQESPDFLYLAITDRFITGIPDYIMLYRGHFAAVELKTPKGRVTQLQEFTLKKMTEAGATCAVIRDVKSFKDFLQQLKAKKNGI